MLTLSKHCTFRNLSTVSKFTTLYAKRNTKNSKLSDKMHVLHQETRRYVNPNARICVKSDINVIIKSADVHDFPNNNVLIAELHGSIMRNSVAQFKVNVNNNNIVDVNIDRLLNTSDETVYCKLHVPITANLNVVSKDSASVADILTSEISISAEKNINTSGIRAEKISLRSENGNINCQGNLLGQLTEIETNNKGNVSFDKVQGDQFTCKTVDGNISTKSCYAENSKFETNTGNLKLMNVHKNISVVVHQGGALNMVGTHGNLSVYSNGGIINIQLSEIHGENTIIANGNEKSDINISERIEKESYIKVSASKVILGDSLSHFNPFVSADEGELCLQNDSKNKLFIQTKGQLQLGMLSWKDMMVSSFSQLNNE